MSYYQCDGVVYLVVLLYNMIEEDKGFLVHY